jgi:hypothetical protein
VKSKKISTKKTKKMKTLKKLLMLSVLLGSIDGAFAQSVTIGEREFTAHPSAILEMQSSNKGVLIPRMTLEQRNTVSVDVLATGLLIYQTNHTPGFYYYDGTMWKFLSAPSENGGATEPNYQMLSISNDTIFLTNGGFVKLPATVIGFSGKWDDLVGKPELFSGNYEDLIGIPAVFDSNYLALKNLPDLFSGKYADLTGIPEVFDSNYFALKNLPNIKDSVEKYSGIGFDGDYENLYNKPNLFSGNYEDLQNLPTLFSGEYADLTGVPEVFDSNYFALKNLPNVKDSVEKYGFDGDYENLQNKPNLFSGNYDELTNKPSLFSGDYENLTNKPDLFSGNYNELTNKPNLFSGSYNDLTNKPDLFSGDYADLHNTPNISALIETHNTSAGSHSDIRQRLVELQGEITSLLSKLDGKSNVVHTHTKSQITDFAHAHTHADLPAYPTLSSLGGVANNDSRLSDARTPTAHTHTRSNITDFAHTHSAGEVGLNNVANERQYSVNNPPPYPVTSVNSRTGAITGLAESTHAATSARTNNTSQYLRADGTWQIPPNDNTTYSTFSSTTRNTSGTLVPASGTSGSVRYLREDGVWQTPPNDNTTYTHPTTTGNRHIPAGGRSGDILRWSANGDATWAAQTTNQSGDLLFSGLFDLGSTSGSVLNALTQTGGGFRIISIGNNLAIYTLDFWFGLSTDGRNGNHSRTLVVTLPNMKIAEVFTGQGVAFHNTAFVRGVDLAVSGVNRLSDTQIRIDLTRTDLSEWRRDGTGGYWMQIKIHGIMRLQE